MQKKKLDTINKLPKITIRKEVTLANSGNESVIYFKKKIQKVNDLLSKATLIKV